MKTTFKELKPGDTFECEYVHYVENSYGSFTEIKTGRFKKINKTFSYSPEDKDGMNFGPDDIVELIDKDFKGGI